RGRGGGKERDEASGYMEYDAHLGWKHRPGARATYHRREYTTEVGINSHGLRDVERDYTTPGRFRILALGDSFVEGYTVPFEQTLTSVLETSLTRPSCPVEVLNAGTAAWSTDQEFLYYREQGAKFSPQVVLVFFYYNDIVSNTIANYFGSHKPLLAAVAEGGLVLTNDPVPRPPPPEPPAAQAPPPAPRGSVAFEWARDRLARGAPRAYNALARLH